MTIIKVLIDCGTINIFGVIVTTISFVLAIVFYIKSKKSKKPYYMLNSINLIKSQLKQLDGILIKYKDDIVENLTVTELTFWNAGKETIDKTDIPETAPLTIKTKDTDITIYGAEVVSMSDISNKMEVVQTKFVTEEQVDEFVVSYDYLDIGQKGVVKILHSGTSDNNLVISGKIKGAGDFKNLKENPVLSIFGFIFAFFVNIIIGLGLYRFLFETGDHIIVWVILCSVAFILLLMLCIIYLYPSSFEHLSVRKKAFMFLGKKP